MAFQIVRSKLRNAYPLFVLLGAIAVATLVSGQAGGQALAQNPTQNSESLSNSEPLTVWAVENWGIL